MAASAVGYGQGAIRYAHKAGEIMLRAKEILGHGEFLSWLHELLPVIDVTERTAQRWMKLAKTTNMSDLMSNPNIKNMTDAYCATGMLPERESKEASESEEKEKPPFVLSFKTRFKSVTEWDKDAARDFLYEFERIGRLAMQLKTEFGI